MLFLYSYVIFASYMLRSTSCQRRIVNGTKSIGEPRYLVYFVKAPMSDRKYTGWVCGGSIVHPMYILTSAACIEDVKHVYAVAGYNKYIKSEDLDKDNCTIRIKKKIVARSFQKDYDLKGEQSFHWSSRDIGLAKVDSPYNFRDPAYTKYCSYPPALIRINFNSNFEEAGTQAVTFGWGHKRFFRTDGDRTDYNEELLNYASTVVIDKELCKNELIGHTDLKININLYLLCTLGPGTLDEKGERFPNSTFYNDSQGCRNPRSEADAQSFRKTSEDECSLYSTNQFFSKLTKQVDYRRHGPCQNDHGGPLVTWIGGREYVIGIACGFQVNKNMECVGPYLYTSTYSNGEFIYCMLQYSRRSRQCDVPPKARGFQIIEENVNWGLNNYVDSNGKNNRFNVKRPWYVFNCNFTFYCAEWYPA